MSISPVVSVVISTYNRCAKLERALKSVFGQTLADMEVIVVDNASSDGTGKLVEGIQDARLRYIRHETNKGGPAARNAGIKASRAAFIAFLDDDDEWMPAKLAAQVRTLQESPASVGLVYVGTEIFDEKSQKVRQSNLPKYRGNVYGRLLLSTILGSVSSVLVRRECFDKTGGFDEQLTSCQDWDMWLRIAQFYEFDHVPEILARINMHGEQISTNYGALIPGRISMVNKHWKEFQKHPNIFVIHLKRIGKLHALNGTWAQAWEWFGKAITVRPTEIIKIMAWLGLEYPWVALFSRTKNFKRYR